MARRALAGRASLGTVSLPHPCVCCGRRTLPGPPGSHEICPLCGWEDDVGALRWPDRPGGANELSLIDAQRHLTRSAGPGLGGLALTGLSPTDPALSPADPADFEQEPFWRPIDPRLDLFEPRGGHLAPWPEDRTVLYWWRRRPGTAWWEETPPVPPTIAEPSASQIAAFHEAMRTVAAQVPPAEADNLSGMAMDFDHYLWIRPSIREVTVSSSPDPARQLTARCLAEPAASPQRVAAEIREAWLRHLRYRYWEAHLLRFTATSVELEVVTRSSADGETGYYITALIVVTWAPSTSA